MAWTWRKRKTIIPGVRLNFGKRGMSMSIGPRGASMTFGPNGTYLNTSIPGTGLYNRQKISGGNNNTNMPTDYSGCKYTICFLLSILMWGLVICIVLLMLASDVKIGGIFAGIVVITHIIVAVVANKKASKVSVSKLDTTSAPLISNKSLQDVDPYQITEAYFSQIEKVVEEIYSDYEKICRKSNLEDLINSIGATITRNNQPITDVNEKARLILIVDIARCYTGLGHILDLDTKEGLGLYYLIARLNGCPNYNSYASFSIVKAEYCKLAEEILKGVQKYIDSNPAPVETFWLSRMLVKCDTILQQKFLVDLYRFASITAKADNTVNAKEAEWLSNIMKLQTKGGHQIVQVEDDEEQVNDMVNVPHIPNLDPIFADVARWIVKKQEGTTASIQRQFEIGYIRAGKLADQLEMAGIIGPSKGADGRDVLIENSAQLEKLLMILQGNDYSNLNEISKTKTTKTRVQNPAKELDSLIGLASVKSEVETLSNFIKIQQTRVAKGLKTSTVSYHCVFTGNPGTGKTTVARILAKIYKNLGVVNKGHLVETDRAGLVAEYVGQTAVKTNKIIDSALDGVLFIDEAYSLISSSENDFGKEAVATLLKRMEDNRDRLIVILAGYTKNMKDFIDSNPGLQSRFNRYIEFPDYSADELLQIFEVNMKKYEYHFGEGANEHLRQYFENEVAHKDANFGNGRLVRNIFEKTIERQANRLSYEINLTTEKLSQIEIEDLPIK